MAVTIEKDTIIGEVLDIAPESASLSRPLACTAWAVSLPG